MTPYGRITDREILIRKSCGINDSEILSGKKGLTIMTLL